MNKYEKKIKEMHEKLAPVDKRWTDMLINNIKVRGYYYKGMVKCMGCGHKFEHREVKKGETITNGVCPHCHRRMTITASKKRIDDDYVYGTVVQNYNDEFVVFRLFCIYYYTRFDKNHNFEVTGGHTCEVRQIWYDIAEDKQTCLSSYLVSYPNNVRNPYREYSDMTIRRKDKAGYYFGSYNVFMTASEVGVVESLPKQISYLNTGEVVADVYYMEDVLPPSIKNPIFESMFKKNMYSMIETLSKKSFLGCEDEDLRVKRTAALKIALRHGYIEKIGENKIGLWRDYINELIQLDNDIHNPFYVCPEDLEAAHAKTSRKVTKIKAEIEKKKQHAEMMKQMPEFIKRVGKFLPFSVSDGTITIEPLKSMEDFIEEATYMGNCLVSNRYYNGDVHPHSLILSARINGWNDGLIIEDIEIDMKTWKVVQCHGRFNKNSEYHDQILNLINANIGEIKKLGKVKKTNKDKKDENKDIQVYEEAI